MWYILLNSELSVYPKQKIKRRNCEVYIGKEIVCYEDEQELIGLVDYYLDNPEEREKIAKRGQKRAYKEHILTHRMKEILSVVK